MLLAEILEGVKFKANGAVFNIDIRDVVDDSRVVKEGDLFVAVRGWSDNGYRFINEAIDKGARAVVAEEDFRSSKGVARILTDDARGALSVIADNFWCHPSSKLKTVAVTGTNGKTTITYIIESILKNARKKSGVIGTISYKIGDRVIPARNTTPGALELQGLLAEMVRNGLGYVAMEVSSHSLDQERVKNIRFDVGIFTNLTSEHMDYHKSMKNYFRAKSRLFDNLKKGASAILNNDDRRVASLKKFIQGNVITYGVREKADITAERVKVSLGGSQFIITGQGTSFEVKTSLVGMHNVSNILAAYAACSALGIRPEVALRGIESISTVPGRLESVELGQPFKVLVDYAHTEDALLNVLSILQNVAQGRIITVFGCGGNRDRKKRPLMGRVACKFSTRVLITSDNPRFEEPMDIIKEIESGVKKDFSNYELVADRKKAIEQAIRMALAGDIVLIAGKGHESYQIIKGGMVPFDDKAVAKEVLKKVLDENKRYSKDSKRQAAVG